MLDKLSINIVRPQQTCRSLSNAFGFLCYTGSFFDSKNSTRDIRHSAKLLPSLFPSIKACVGIEQKQYGSLLICFAIAELLFP